MTTTVGFLHGEEHENHDARQSDRLKAIGGSRSERWSRHLANQAALAIWRMPQNEEDKLALLRAHGDAIMGIGPRDELEGMLAAQIIAAHNASMDAFRRAIASDTNFELRQECLNQANRLSRTFAMLLDALDHHRNRGAGVTVQHIHVQAAAVVEQESEDQPHAKPDADAPRRKMRRKNKGRKALQSAGDDQRPMPNARRRIAGSAKRK